MSTETIRLIRDGLLMLTTLYSAILHSWVDTLLSHVTLHEWIAFCSTFLWISTYVVHLQHDLKLKWQWIYIIISVRLCYNVCPLFLFWGGDQHRHSEHWASGHKNEGQSDEVGADGHWNCHTVHDALNMKMLGIVRILLSLASVYELSHP